MGFQGGINVAAFSGHKNYDENKPRFGLSAYVFSDIPLGHNSIVSVETGLAISQQGMNHTRITNDIASRNTLTVHNRLDYVYIPIYLKENFTNFYTKLGPYGAYLVNVKSRWKNVEEQSYKVISEDSGIDEDFAQNARPFDIGLSLGCGYIHFFEPGPRRYKGRGRKKLTPVIQIDFRYNIGFTSLDLSGNNPDMNFRSRTFTIGLSITSVRN
jgi:hypothetical protein